MNSFKRVALSVFLPSALVVSSVSAVPLDLDAPSPLLGNLDRDATLLVVDDLRQADFGNGLRFPVRWVYRSSDQATDNAYGWAGFNLTILEAKAVKKSQSLYVVTMPSGEVEYFTRHRADAGSVLPPTPPGGEELLASSGGSNGGRTSARANTRRAQLRNGPAQLPDPTPTPAGPGPQSQVWKNNNAQWTGAESDSKFTIKRWDGWEIEFREGRIWRLKTDKGRTLRWEYDSEDPRLVTRVYEPSTNETAISVGLSGSDLHMAGSSTLRGAHTLTVNGDTYTFTYEGGTLKNIEFPDGRRTQWKFQALGDATSRLTLTQESGWWRSWVFGTEDRRVRTDDYWSYTITGGEPAENGLVYYRPTMERTRLATGETEKLAFESSNSVWKRKDVLGNEDTTHLYKSLGKLYNAPFRRERKKPGESSPTVVWRGVYNASTGDLIRSFDALDKETTYAYERFPDSSEFLPPKITTITDPAGRVSRIERDEEGNVIEVTGPDGVKRKLEYDDRRRITRVKNADNQVLLRLVYGEQDQVVERYDARGKKTSFGYEVFLGVPKLTKITTPEGKVTDLERDEMGRVSKITAPSDAEWDYRYVGDWSVVEKITDPAQAETSFEYDARLNPIKKTDPLNRITRAIYDDLDLPIEITDALNQKTEFQNNGNRDMKKLTDARNNSYDMAWERRGLRKSLQWPGGDKQQSFFDGNDRLSQWKAKADAGVVTIFRNDAGQVTGRTWTAEPGLSGNVTFGRNSLGQITDTSATVLGETISQSLGYDAEGRLSSIAQTAASLSRSASVLYDLDGRVTSITYPAGFTVTYDYNDDGQILAIKKDGSLVASYAYDTAGRLSTRTLANGCVTTYGYDAADRLESITLSSGSNVLWAERYGFNPAGERIYTLHGATGTVGDGYWLDATSQLRGVKHSSTQATQPYSNQNGAATEWQYDAVGNRLAQATANTTVTYAAANSSNQYTTISSTGTLAYSARGDLSQLGDWTFSYDAQGNLIRAENSQTNTIAHGCPVN